MAWYKTGTIAVTNGATAVTGTGTRFASNARVGDALRGLDGEWYEIVNIASETTLGIFPAYQGTTGTGANYTIAPMQGYVKESADRLREITNSLRDITADVAAARESAVAAAASEAAASTSATAAKTSETNSKASENAAKASQTAAGASQTAAAGSAAAALVSQNAAKVSETNSKTSETNAKASETAASGSAAAAAISKTGADTAKTAAEAARNAAQTAETNANTARTGAETARTNALNSANAALASQNAAKTSETNSKTSETNSKTSETNSKASENKAKAWAENPENTIVETGKYSALHWAAKAKASADQAAAVTGPRLTSITTAVLAVNDMLIADSTTTMAKIATSASGRSVLSGTPAEGRTALQLGTAAIANLALSQTEAGNNVLRTGDRGIGRSMSIVPGQNLNTLLEPGMYQYTSGVAPVNSPHPAAQYIEVIGTPAYPVQFVYPIYGSKTWSRSCKVGNPTAAAADWNEWAPVYSAQGENFTGDMNTIVVNSSGVTNATATNVPIGQGTSTGQGYYVHSQALNIQYALQTWKQITSGQSYSRLKIAGVWQAWVKDIQIGDFGLGDGFTNLLGATTNLNDVGVRGFYGQQLNAQATPALNYPVALAGTLLVGTAAGTIVTQMYTAHATGDVYTRASYSGVWSAWQKSVSVQSSGVNDLLLTSQAVGVAQPWNGNRFVRWDVSSPDSPGATNSVGVDMGYAINRRMQIGISTSAQFYSRYTTDASVQTGWQRHYTNANIIGTVFDASGVVSGAIIERGSNANGEYVKFADGTMICWFSESRTDKTITSAYGTLFTGAHTWTFPVAFYSQPTFIPTSYRWGNGASWVAPLSTPTVTQASFAGVDIQSRAAGTTTILSAVAIGRWKA